MSAAGSRYLGEESQSMKVRARFGILALLVTSMALLLSACIQIDVESEFEADGSGTHSIETTIDRSIMDDEMMGAEFDEEGFDFDEVREEGEAAGFEVEEIDTADRVGVRLTTHVDDNSDMGDVLNDLFTATGGEGPPVEGFEGSFTESGGGIGGSNYRFELTVDGNALFEDEFAGDMEDDLDDGMDMDFGPDMLRQFMNLTYTVSMPGEITDHNGTDLGGGRVQWDIPFQGSETFFAESEDGSGLSLALILGIGVGALALVLIIVGGIVLMRPRKAPVDEPADSGTS